MFASNTSQVSSDVNYIEDFFSAWLRTGTGSSQTVTTGIKENTGALVISKSRSAATDWAWYDTFRGATKDLVSNSTAAETTQSQGLTSFNADGHTWGTLAKVNTSGATYVDYVLKPQPKFFDVVTWTGDGSNYRAISHALGSTPGMVIVKSTSASGAWAVWHRSTDPNNLILNSTSAAISGQYSIQDVGSTSFAVANSSFYGFPQSIPVNDNGATYVAYLFAHNAGGFGLTGTDNVISCGSFTGGSSVNLGYEPQWLMYKRTDNVGNWIMLDTMRGFNVNDANRLLANTSGSEGAGFNSTVLTNTGFNASGETSGATYIYIAIRRGPMKTPTSGTSVFAVNLAADGATAPVTWSTGFNVDSVLTKRNLSDTNGNNIFVDRLRGNSATLTTNSTSAEGSNGNITDLTISNGYIQKLVSTAGSGGAVTYAFGRAPGFFDEVCDSTGGPTIYHNLGVAPELIIAKVRNYSPQDWFVDVPALGSTRTLNLNTTGAASSTNYISSPTASQFTTTLGGGGYNYVYYLFASCPGVSKVGSYTGNGSSQTINCGFTGGARFVMIKRTNSTGDWYVWDSARGIVAGNDPYLLLNSTAAEVTNTDYVDTYSAGFEISSTAPAAINASGGTFIFLAIA